MRNNEITNKPNLALLVAAFATIYTLWGSTYLAIKFAIETLPPFTMTGARYLLAGATMYLAGRFSKDYERPTLTHWRASFIVGLLLFFGGTSSVAIAEHYIPSGLAALLVATEPFWIVILSWLWLKGGAPNGKVIMGLLIGFLGVYLLLGDKGLGNIASGSQRMFGAALVIGGGFCWAAGSIYGLRAPTPKSALVTAGMQMLMGGAVLVLAGLLAGEWTNFDLAAVSLRSWLGIAYLYLFGSLIGFTAYSWLLKNARPTAVATYAYVNPVVAVFLGWAFASEPVTLRMLLGAVVIVGSVVLITSRSSKAAPEASRKEAIDPAECPAENQASYAAS